MSFILKTFAPDPPYTDPFAGLPDPGSPAYEAMRRRNAGLREWLRSQGRCEWCAEAECRCEQPSDDAEAWDD